MADERVACDAGISEGEEGRLRREFLGGSEAVFVEVVERYGPQVSRLARRLLGWREGEVEDAVQEVFVRAYVGRRSYRGDSSLGTWLMWITVNVCRSTWRRKMMRAELLRRMMGRKEAAAVDDEVSERVRGAVRRLAVKEREVIVLYYLEEIGARAIAGMLKISEGAVHVRLHRGRQRLEQLLGADGGTGDE